MKDLRRNRGDAAGVELDASLVDRFEMNVGTIRCRPTAVQPARRKGQARRRLMASGGAEAL